MQNDGISNKYTNIKRLTKNKRVFQQKEKHVQRIKYKASNIKRRKKQQKYQKSPNFPVKPEFQFQA